MLAGFDRTKGDATVIIDADLQDPPELIPKMIKYWEDGYDDVYAKRRSRSGETWLKKKTSQAYYRILRRSTAIPIQEDTGDLRLLDGKAVAALREFRESQRNTKALFSWVGFKKKEILYDRDPRAAGETKWNYFKLVNLAIDGVTSTDPVNDLDLDGRLSALAAYKHYIQGSGKSIEISIYTYNWSIIIPKNILKKHKKGTAKVKNIGITLAAKGFNGKAVINHVGGWATGSLWKSGSRWKFSGWIWSWRDSYDFDNYYGSRWSFRNITTRAGKIMAGILVSNWSKPKNYYIYISGARWHNQSGG